MDTNSLPLEELRIMAAKGHAEKNDIVEIALPPISPEDARHTHQGYSKKGEYGITLGTQSGHEEIPLPKEKLTDYATGVFCFWAEPTEDGGKQPKALIIPASRVVETFDCLPKETARVLGETTGFINEEIPVGKEVPPIQAEKKIDPKELPKLGKAVTNALRTFLKENRCQLIDDGELDYSELCLQFKNKGKTHLVSLEFKESALEHLPPSAQELGRELCTQLHNLLKENRAKIGVVSDYEDRDFAIWSEDLDSPPKYAGGLYLELSLLEVNPPQKEKDGTILEM